tara:strand:+ start:1021 stop:1614 length:594 start_codon:yes stop_codon:yes gene_type:complete
MEIHQEKIDNLKMADYNPRVLTEHQEKTIRESLERFGFVDPIVVNKNKKRMNIIVGGHQRVKVAKKMGLKEVPTVHVKLEENEERELNVRLNKNTGEWDWALLEQNFTESELVKFGFQDFEINFGDDSIDYSILDETDLASQMGKLEAQGKKSLLIDFTLEQHAIAEQAAKVLRSNDVDLGEVVLKAFIAERKKLNV